MPLKVSNIRLPVEAPEAALRAAVAEKLGTRPDELTACRILRKSLDARSRTNLRFVYSVHVELPDERQRLEALAGRGDVLAFAPQPFFDPPSGTEPLDERPVVVGSGPAGLLAGYYLAIRGYRPLIVERGQPVKQRVPAIRTFDRGAPHDPENNYLFGEGGAGTFSDGKLTCRISGPDVDWVLERFVECGGTDSIRYEQRPHLGSNRLPLLVRNFRRKIEAAGGEYRFGCRFEGLQIADGRITGIETSSGPIRCGAVVLAIGHSARDTYEVLHQAGVPMQRKAFQLGLRIEQPQVQVNRQCYGREIYEELLGAADYTLVAKGRRDLYTFCMCAGGNVIPSVSEPEMFCTNGMSNSRHDSPFANSGVMVTLQPDEFGSADALAGVYLQRRFEAKAFEIGNRDYLAPIQRAHDFLDDRAPGREHLPCSYQRGTRPARLDPLLPEEVLRAIRAGLPVMDHKFGGNLLENAVLVGPEMRGSSPVRIERDRQTRQAPGFAGLFPVGEGAGYAGGIVTAAVDGLRSARAIVETFAPLGVLTRRHKATKLPARQSRNREDR